MKKRRKSQPGQLRVGALVYAVRTKKNLRCLAETHHDRLRIDLARGLAGPVRGEVLMHEALHAAFFASGLSANARIARVEEEIVSALAPILAPMIADNPGLIAFLVQEFRR